MIAMPDEPNGQTRCKVCGTTYPKQYVTSRGWCEDCRESGAPRLMQAEHGYPPPAYASPAAQAAWSRFLLSWNTAEAMQGLWLYEVLADGLPGTATHHNGKVRLGMRHLSLRVRGDMARLALGVSADNSI